MAAVVPKPEAKSVGDAYDNAVAESFVDSFKTELIADRVRRTKTQLELAIVEYISWFNHDRLHGALGIENSLDELQQETTNPVSVKAGPAQQGCGGRPSGAGW